MRVLIVALLIALLVTPAYAQTKTEKAAQPARGAAPTVLIMTSLGSVFPGQERYICDAVASKIAETWDSVRSVCADPKQEKAEPRVQCPDCTHVLRLTYTTTEDVYRRPGIEIVGGTGSVPAIEFLLQPIGDGKGEIYEGGVPLDSHSVTDLKWAAQRAGIIAVSRVVNR